MKEHTCQAVSKEELAAYADGDLPRNETERIAQHLATCPHCRAVTEALERSLEITQAIWQTGRSKWPETRSFESINRPSFRRMAAVAAGILLIVGAGAMWLLWSEPSERTGEINDQAKVAELRRKIADSGDAARLLAAAELLSRYPETESLVQARYRHIIEAYPATAAAAEVRMKIRQLKHGDPER